MRKVIKKHIKPIFIALIAEILSSISISIFKYIDNTMLLMISISLSVSILVGITIYIIVMEKIDEYKRDTKSNREAIIDEYEKKVKLNKEAIKAINDYNSHNQIENQIIKAIIKIYGIEKSEAKAIADEYITPSDESNKSKKG